MRPDRRGATLARGATPACPQRHGRRTTLVGLVAMAVLATACGTPDPQLTNPDADGIRIAALPPDLDDPGPQDDVGPEDDRTLRDEVPGAASVVAPWCEDVTPIVVQLPEGVASTGTQARPVDDSYLHDVPGWTSARPRRDLAVADLPQGGSDARPHDDGLLTDPRHDDPLVQEVIPWWGGHNGEGIYAGHWYDETAGTYVVALVGDVDTYASLLRGQLHPGLGVAEARFSLTELRSTSFFLNRMAFADTVELIRLVPDALINATVIAQLNRVVVTVDAGDDDQLAELTDLFGADRICFEMLTEPIGDDAEPAPLPSHDLDDLPSDATSIHDGMSPHDDRTER